MVPIGPFAALICLFAAPDNNVEWNGCSHVGWLDRRPLCPMNGQAFTVLFRAYRFDLTSARINVNTGSSVWIDADFDHDDGPYAIWRADIPATGSQTLHYYIELNDGTDTDYLSATGMSDGLPSDGGWEIDFVTLPHAPVGATPVTVGGVVFKVWAPNAAQGFVAGEFNNWTAANPMTKRGDYFIAHVPSALDRHQYKFVFNPGVLWRPDARGRALNATGGYNSYVENPLRYAWTSNSYSPPAFEDLIIYELHVGTFAGRNDPAASGSIPATYRDVAAHADHLAELGVTAVLLMPVTEFPTDFSAGYNPITQWAPEWRYGTPDDLKYLVDTLHAHGIAVHHDIVWNHFSPSDNFLWNYDSATQQIYYHVPDIQTQWGSQADFCRGEVREYFQQSALLWLDEYRMDGFRMDATDYMNIFPQEACGWSLMQWYNDTIDNRWANKISIAEQLPNDDWVTRPTSLGGAGFDAQWHDAFTDNLRQAVLDAAFGDPSMGAIAFAINGSSAGVRGPSAANYLELHDELMTSTGGGRIIKVIDPTFPHDDMWAKGRYKLAQGLVVLAPGIPMIHQGSEWLEDTNFGGGNAGGADRINWALKTTNASIFQFFKDVIAVRKSNGAFRANAGWQTYHVNDGTNVIAFQRYDASGNVCVVVANFNNSNLFNYRIGLPQSGTWTELLNSQASVYDGNNVGNGGSIQTEAVAYNGHPQSAVITIPQMGLLVFRHGAPTPPCPGDLNRDGEVSLADLTQLLANFGTTSGATAEQGDMDADGDVDIADLAAFLSRFGAGCP